MLEIWKEITGHINYMISNYGRILSKRNGLIRKYNTTKTGYKWLIINYKNYTVHRLVALHFIPNPNNLKEINHKDKDKSNNNVSNLEWINHKDNCYHGNSKRVLQFSLRNEFLKEFESTLDTGFGTHVGQVCNGQRKTAYGYKWKWK